MKAIVCREHGTADVLRLEEMPKPIPGEKDVLIRVRAAAVNPLDWHFMRAVPPFLRLFIRASQTKPLHLGVDAAGDVEAVGSAVTACKAGDRVFGAVNGAFAEYASGPESAVAMIPQNVTYEQAAAVPIAGLTALQALRDKGHVKPGNSVLINGAAGGVGTFAVQIAKSMGADVTGVCSGRNVELVHSIGADRLIDYSREDFATDRDRYDVILDLIGNRPLPAILRVLKPKGVFIGCGGGGPDASVSRMLAGMLRMLITNLFVSQKLTGILARRSKADLEFLSNLMHKGSIKPVIDRTYCLAEVPDAIRYLEQGHARGKVVIAMDQHC